MQGCRVEPESPSQAHIIADTTVGNGSIRRAFVRLCSTGLDHGKPQAYD